MFSFYFSSPQTLKIVTPLMNVMITFLFGIATYYEINTEAITSLQILTQNEIEFKVID